MDIIHDSYDYTFIYQLPRKYKKNSKYSMVIVLPAVIDVAALWLYLNNKTV